MDIVSDHVRAQILPLHRSGSSDPQPCRLDETFRRTSRIMGKGGKGKGKITKEAEPKPTSSPRLELMSSRLGRTEGAFAAGAWAAREEMASLLESGIPPEDLIAQIRAGQEGDHKLDQVQILKAQTGRSRSPVSSRGSGKPSSEKLRKGPLPSYDPADKGRSERDTFRKRACPPADEEVPPASPGYSVGTAYEEAAAKEEGMPSTDPSLEACKSFKKKAVVPEEPPQPQRSFKPFESLRVPKRKDPRTADKYQAYDTKVLALFEELVILEVKMDLIPLVSKGDPPEIDEDRFKQLTDPRSPDTGIRYVNLMKRFLEFLRAKKSETEKSGDLLAPESVGAFVEHLISSCSGYRTPQAFLYSLEYFSVLFGFQTPKIQFRRWKRLADDYADKAPPRSGAPHFNVDFLGYLEVVVLDVKRSPVERVTAGKLRLCIQASIRHNDLLSTPMNMMEWCRFMGSTKAAGVRAKAPHTKSGVRPWVASFLGVCPAGDGWLEATMDLLIKSHGDGWKTHEFCGCAPDGENSFLCYPSCLGTDVEILRSMVARDIQAGKGPSMSLTDASAIRWHGAKATLTSYMVHFDVKTKYVRYQGGWRKSNEAMPDLYLREAQSVVLKAQVQTIDMLRRGAALQLLEGRPLDFKTFEFPFERTEGEAGWDLVGELPTGVSREKAVAAMERAKVYDFNEAGHLQAVPGSCPNIEDLAEELRDLDPHDEDAQSILDEEAQTELDVDDLLTDSPSSDEGEENDSECEDLEIFDHFIVVQSGRGKIHKPSKGDDLVPACGIVSANFVRLEVDENWGDNYELCARCFGPAGRCGKMCSHVAADGTPRRCGRRCQLNCSECDLGGDRAKSALAFGRAAVNFDLNESDYLLLLKDNIKTYEDMSYRFPKMDDFDEYLKKTIRTQSAYRDQNDEIKTYQRRNITPWEKFKTEEDTGCLRKLYSYSAQIAKRELEKLASQGEEAKHKVTLAMASEMEQRAIDESMPPPLSDRERPSLYSLGKTQAAYSTGGSFEYINWEAFVDSEWEGVLRRSGKLPKDRQRLVYSDNQFSLTDVQEELVNERPIKDATDLRETLEIRARCFHMLKVCEFEVCRKLTERYLSKLRATQPEGMRGPTLNEVRRTDREIFGNILSWVAKGEGSIQNGLTAMLEDTGHHLWRLLDPQVKNLPDQGRDQKLGAPKVEKASSAHTSGNKRAREDSVSPEGETDTRRPRMCIVCRKRHEPRCEIPPGFRKENRERQRALKASKGRGKGGGKSKSKPRVKDGRVVSFATGEEREYPEEFCEAYATALKELSDLEEGFNFLEVFSGPNAPLSKAVASHLQCELVPPRGSLVEADGKQVEKSEASGENSGGISPLRHVAMQVEQGSKYRQDAVQSARQPSYGKRVPLIEDGTNSPSEHLERAKLLCHPFDSQSGLKGDHRAAIDFMSKDPEIVNSRRLQTLSWLEREAARLEPAQTRENAQASWTAVKLGTRPKTVLMRRLQEILEIEDTQVPDICLKGVGIIGDASVSPFFDDFDVPPSVSKDEYFKGMEARSLRMIERVRFMAQKSSPQLQQAIWEKTQKEVKAGTMGPPMSLRQIQALYPEGFQVVPSFGLEQGESTDGSKKFRRIDDHSACLNNHVAHRKQKVPMAMADYVALLIKSGSAMPESDLLIASEDMKSAYRQIPLSPEHVRYSITAVFNPQTSAVELHEIYGQPFGAGHAVPNFCRVSEWISRCLSRLYGMCLDHFFDDFFWVEPRSTAQVAVHCVQKSFSLLGFLLDSDKSQPPELVCPILGVLFNTTKLSSDHKLLVEPKPTRVANLIRVIDSVLESGELSPALAASIVGKFGFLCSTLYGKVGRCCTGPLRTRQYQSHGWYGLNSNLIISLRLMREFIRLCPRREIPLISGPPVILYTDASDVPDRSPRWIVGAVLFDPKDNTLHYSAAAVPNLCVQQWLPKSSYMGQLELLAAPFGLSTWQHRLADRSIILWIDNDSAAANLVKGYSPKSDSSSIVGSFWLLAAQLRSSIYIDRVWSAPKKWEPKGKSHGKAGGRRWKPQQVSIAVAGGQWVWVEDGPKVYKTKGKGKGKGVKGGKAKGKGKRRAAPLTSEFWTKKVEAEGRKEIGETVLPGVISRYSVKQGYGFIKPDNPQGLPNPVKKKMNEAEAAVEAEGKEVKEKGLLYFRKPDVNHEEGFKLAEGTAVTFRLYVDNLGAGALDVSMA
eukprot:s1626_g9.t1